MPVHYHSHLMRIFPRFFPPVGSWRWPMCLWLPSPGAPSSSVDCSLPRKVVEPPCLNQPPLSVLPTHISMDHVTEGSRPACFSTSATLSLGRPLLVRTLPCHNSFPIFPPSFSLAGSALLERGVLANFSAIFSPVHQSARAPLYQSAQVGPVHILLPLRQVLLRPPEPVRAGRFLFILCRPFETKKQGCIDGRLPVLTRLIFFLFSFIHRTKSYLRHGCLPVATLHPQTFLAPSLPPS